MREFEKVFLRIPTSARFYYFLLMGAEIQILGSELFLPRSACGPFRTRARLAQEQFQLAMVEDSLARGRASFTSRWQIYAAANYPLHELAAGRPRGGNCGWIRRD